jgi:hypothetical protein
MTSTLPPLVQAFSGAIGSAAANSLVYPLDLVTTRLQTSRSKHTGLSRALHILRSIINKHGLFALYDGLDTDTAATLLSKYVPPSHHLSLLLLISVNPTAFSTFISTPFFALSAPLLHLLQSPNYQRRQLRRIYYPNSRWVSSRVLQVGRCLPR